MATTTLSVILTVYNMQECLRAFLNSLVAQTWKDYEVICINDGSTDESKTILLEYADKLPSFQLIDQENSGVSAARNLGLSKAHGDYLIMLDSDDLLDPCFLQKMIDTAKQANADVTICRSNEFHHRTGVWHKTPWATRTDLFPCGRAFSVSDIGGDIFLAFAGWPWDKLYRTDFVKEHGLFFPMLRNSEDLCFVYPSLVKAERIAFVDCALIHHRTNRSGSVSNSLVSKPRDFYAAVEFLKSSLKETDKYPELEQGFLNWAIDFTLWNIESLPSGQERLSLISDLCEGKLHRLELNDHPRSYFSLYPRTIKRLSALENELKTGKISNRRSVNNIASTLWNYISTLDIASTLSHTVKARKHHG